MVTVYDEELLTENTGQSLTYKAFKSKAKKKDKPLYGVVHLTVRQDLPRP